MFTIRTNLRRMPCFCTLRPGPFFPHPTDTSPAFLVPTPTTCLCPCHPTTTPLPRIPNLTLAEQLLHIDTSIMRIHAVSKIINNRQIALDDARAVHDRQHPPPPPPLTPDVEEILQRMSAEERDAWEREQPQRPCECACEWGRRLEGERKMLVGLYARTWFAWHFYDHWQRGTMRAEEAGLRAGPGREEQRHGDVEPGKMEGFGKLSDRGKYQITWDLVHGEEEKWKGQAWFEDPGWIEKMPPVGMVDEEAKRRREMGKAGGEGGRRRMRVWR